MDAMPGSPCRDKCWEDAGRILTEGQGHWNPDTVSSRSAKGMRSL